MRAAGTKLRLIAEQFGLSVSQVKQVLKNEREAENRPPVEALDLDPHRIFAEVVADHRDVLRRLAVVADRATNDSAVVGALKNRALVGAQLLHVLRIGGAAPPTPERWRHERDLTEIAARMIDAVDEFDRRMMLVAISVDGRREIEAAVAGVVRTFREIVGIEDPPVLEIGGMT